MSKALRLLPAIAALLIIGGIGTNLLWAGEKIKVAHWATVQPKLVMALTGKELDVKVGQGYRFKKMDFVNEMILGFRWIVSPKKAGARQVLNVYDLNSVRNYWDKLRAEFGQDPVNVAFMTKHEDAYFGTPVKWNKGFANSMKSVWQVEFGEADYSNVFAQAVAEEIVTLAAYQQVSPILAKSSPRALQVLGVDQRVMKTGWPDKQTMDMIRGRNVEAVKNLRPSITFYIAFSREPKALSDVSSLGKVVSTSGWQGEILGETVTGWPVEKHE